MKVVILYHPVSDHARKVEEFAYEYKKRTGKEVELASLETKEGSEMAKLYDIVAYPAVLVIRDNAELIKNWEGNVFPLISEVQAYMAS